MMVLSKPKQMDVVINLVNGIKLKKNGLKIIEGQNGLFVAMPSRRMPNGEFKDIAHPITLELRSELTRVVLEAYEKESAAAE